MEGEAEADRCKAFIKGLSEIVSTEEAVQLLQTMESRGVPPTTRCFNGALLACDRAGQPDAALALLDKRLLTTDYLISDEVLAACIVIGGLISVLAFIAITLAVEAVDESVYLLVAGSTWMRDVSTDAAAPVRALVAQGVELGVAGLEQLRRAEHQLVPAVSHLLEQIGSSNNGTVVVMSTFDKLRECYPMAAWVSQAEDLGRLVLWASGAASVAVAGAALVLLEARRRLALPTSKSS